MEFDWDDANIGHIGRHGVSPEEVEQALANKPLAVVAEQARSGEKRVLCAGFTNDNRPLQFVYTIRQGKIRVITAHTAHKKIRGKL